MVLVVHTINIYTILFELSRASIYFNPCSLVALELFFAISPYLDLFPRLFLRLTVALGSEDRARVTLALASPRRWLQRARKVVSLRPILVFWTRRLRAPTQSEAFLFFCNSAGDGNFKHLTYYSSINNNL